VSSVFCGQFGEPILKNQGAKRKATFEKMFGLTDLNIYADVAKRFLDEAVNEQKGSEIKVESMKGLIENITARVAENKERELNFHKERERVTKELTLKLEEAMKGLSEAAPTYDAAEIIKKWDVIDKINDKISSMQEEMKELVADKERNEREIERITNEIKEKKEKLSGMEEPDMEELNKQDALYKDALDKIQELNAQVSEADSVVAVLHDNMKQLQAEIDNITNLEGTTCPECKQPVSGEHCEVFKDRNTGKIDGMLKDVSEVEELKSATENKIKELKKIEKPNLEAARLTLSVISDLQKTIKTSSERVLGLSERGHDNEISQKGELIEQTLKSVQENKPAVSREEITAAANNHKSKKEDLDDARRRIKEESNKENPYNEAVKEMSNDLEEEKAKLSKETSEIGEYNSIIKHLKYIRRAYFNRDKIKSFIIANMVPYLNRRIHYYLSSFGIPFTLKFTSSLGIEMHKWDYTTCSGGEQKSIDVAVQLALYDLYTMMYGSQCNIMVLDEIDGSLDPVGVEYFVEIVNNDFAHRIETILIISHKEEMIDAFPSKITIEKHIVGEIGNSHVVTNGIQRTSSEHDKSTSEEGILEEASD
jgi:exonuclease SbcC